MLISGLKGLNKSSEAPSRLSSSSLLSVQIHRVLSRSFFFLIFVFPKGAVTLGKRFCNLSRNLVAIQVAGEIAQCNIP